MYIYRERVSSSYTFAAPSAQFQLGTHQVLLRRNVQWFQGGLVLKAHRLLYHSTLCLRVITKKRRHQVRALATFPSSVSPKISGSSFWVSGFGR